MQKTKREQEIGVLGLIVNDKGEFLITLRHEPELPEAHLKWQIPGGGIEFGEKPLETLKREMEEEVGVKVKVLDSPPIVDSCIWKYQGKEVQVILICYLCKIKSGKIKLDGEETVDYRWIKPEEIKSLDYLPLTDDFILTGKRYLDKKN